MPDDADADRHRRLSIARASDDYGVEPLLDVLTVARVLGVSDRTVWRYVRDGALGHVRIDGRTMVAPDQVRRFIDAHRIDPDR